MRLKRTQTPNLFWRIFMVRIACFVAGCIVGYVASGYIEGFREQEEDRRESLPEGTEGEA